MKKFISLVTFIVLSMFVLVGCNSNSSSTPSDDSNKENEKQITVGVEAGGPYSEFYKSIANEFTEDTGIKINFIDVPHDSMHQRFLTEAMSGAGAIDVYQTDQPWISEFASNGFLEPLSSRIGDEDISDFIEGALETVKYEDEIYGLPYLVHTPIIYYRTDLFEEAGFENPPTTWEDYRQYANELNSPDAGIHGTLIEGKQSGEPVTHLLDILHQAGGEIWNENGEVNINSPEVQKAFEYLFAIQHEDQSSPEGAVGYDNADAHNLFMQGKVAMIKNWPYMYSLANDPGSSKVAGNFAVAAQPKGEVEGSAIWSWGFGISSDSKDKDASWEFVKWATSSEVVQKLGVNFINPVPRYSALDAIANDSSVSEADSKAIAIMSDAIVGGVSFTENPKFPAIQERLAVTLSKIMSKQVDVEIELEATEKDIQAILSK